MPPYASRVSCDPALTCSAVSSLNHAGISSSATIVGGSGDTSGATLRVMRPDNMSDDAVATYLIQAYADDKATTKVGPSFCRSEVAVRHSLSYFHAGPPWM